jgi:tRNA threonylcarbamoyl adenosine modification protein (Sua5/YciO/YrdC/YwlC family)
VTLTVLPGFGADGVPDQQVARRAAEAWLAGGLVGLPTETVYGLAADAEHPGAVARVFRAKGRPADHPLIVHVAGVAALPGWTAGAPGTALQLAEAYWPGPLTVIVARGARASDLITGGQGTVALRCPAHPVARACLAALVEASGDPARGVAAPSANRFGRVSPTSALDVVAELADRLDPGRDLVIDGGRSVVGVESTIVDCTGRHPRVLRLGAISQAEVDAVLGVAAATSPADAERRGGAAGGGTGDGGTGDRGAEGVGASGASAALGAALEGDLSGGQPTDPAGDPAQPGQLATPERQQQSRLRDAAGSVRAPGTLDSHYAPRARVVLVEAAVAEAALPGLASIAPVPGLVAPAPVATPAGWMRLAAPETPAQYAQQLYAALRRADERGLRALVAVLPASDEGPLAEAVRDRLTRAAHAG